MADSIAVVGAGGHAKVVIAAARAAGLHVSNVYDDAPDRYATTVLGLRVEGTLDDLVGSGPKWAVLAIGDNAARKRAVERLHGIEWVPLVHPSAWVHDSVVIGPGTVVFAGAQLQPDTHVGAHVIVNTGATVDHDCRLHDYVHIAPGVNLAGTVTLEEGAFLGIGSHAIPGRRIGAWTQVGAGATVIHDLPPRVTAVGNPARVLRDRSPRG